jgi:hypothetical protein
MSDWAASIVSSDFSQRVDISASLISLSGVVRHLAGGEWSAELKPSVFSALKANWPGQDEAPLLLMLRWADNRLGTILSGPIRTATLERDGGVSKLTIGGVDEYAGLLGSRVVWPQPADLPPWTTDAYDDETGQASAVAAALITNHLGVGARAERQVDVTVVDESVGPTGTWRYRLTQLDHAIADVAKAGDLTVDVRRDDDGGLTVTIGETRDRTNYIVNEAKLDDFAVTLSTGTTTTIIVGGGGEGTGRLFALAGETVEGVARQESFADQRNIATQPSLDAAAAATRAAGAASTSLTGQLLDPSTLTWRTHYQLGDIVTLQAEGTRWETPVTAVNVDLSAATGLRISPVLGRTTSYALTQLIRDVDGLSSRLSSLEVS